MLTQHSDLGEKLPLCAQVRAREEWAIWNFPFKFGVEIKLVYLNGPVTSSLRSARFIYERIVVNKIYF